MSERVKKTKIEYEKFKLISTKKYQTTKKAQLRVFTESKVTF